MSRITSILVLFLITAFGPSQLLAELDIFPKRVLLTNQKSTSEIKLTHTGAHPAKYRIKPIFYRMLPDGSLKKVTNPNGDERPAMKYIRVSPLEVTLKPNVNQMVKVMVRGAEKAIAADYRCHLLFEEIEEFKPKPRRAAQGEKPELAGVKLWIPVAVAIPIIYRHGKTNLKVSLSNLKVIKSANNNPAFEVSISQSGNQFAHGAFKAYFTPKGKKTGKQVGLIRGISSYVAKRKMSFPLKVPDGTKFENGTLRLEFVRPEDEGGNLLASAQVAVK